MTLQTFLKDIGLPNIEVDAIGIKLNEIPGVSDSFLSYQDLDQDARSEKILAGTTIDRCVQEFKELSSDLGRSIKKARQGIYTGGAVGASRRVAG